MTVRAPVFLQSGSYVAQDIRQMIAGQAAAGVIHAADFITSAGGGMSVNVSAGSAFVAGTEATTQGTYYVINDAPVNRVVAASDPTNARNDLVILRVRDAALSGAFNDGDVVVVTGVASGTPVDPAVPNNSVILARLVIPALASSVIAGYIQDIRQMAVETWPSQATTGLIGAQAGTRTVGATAGGPPTTGTFAIGDTVTDRTYGLEWICTAAGTPGTWKVSSDPAMFGVGGAVVGATPSLVGARFLMQAGTAVVTTSGAGLATIPYPVAFPNGVLMNLAQAADNIASFASIQIQQSGQALGQFQMNCLTPSGAAIVSTALRINWLAIGT